jgi:hypothetical protein
MLILRIKLLLTNNVNLEFARKAMAAYGDFGLIAKFTGGSWFRKHIVEACIEILYFYLTIEKKMHTRLLKIYETPSSMLSWSRYIANY